MLDRPLTPLRAARTKHAEASSRLTTINAALERIETLKGDAVRAHARLREHDADLGERMAEWAKSASSSNEPPPQGDAEGRRELLAAIEDAEARVTSAGMAHAALLEDAAAAIADRDAEWAAVEDAAREEILEEHADLVAEVDLSIEALLGKLTRVLGLAHYAVEVSQAHREAGRDAEFRRMAELAVRLSPVAQRLRRDDGLIAPLPSHIAAAADFWAQRERELVGDPA